MKSKKVAYKEITFVDNDMNFTKKGATGVLIEVTELPEYKFAYRYDGSKWIVTEISSGCMFANAKIRKDIPDAIQRRLKMFGAEKIKRIIEENTVTYAEDSIKCYSQEQWESITN